MRTIVFTLDTIDDERPFEFIANGIETLNDQSQDLTYAWEINPDLVVEPGDQFYIVSTINGYEGICGNGYVCSEPYEDEDEGESHLFVDLEPLVLVNPATATPIDAQRLKSIFQTVSMDESETGLLLDGDKAEKLDLLWLEYIFDNQTMFDSLKAATSWDFSLENFETVTENVQNYLLRTRGRKCEVCGKEESDREIVYHLILDDKVLPGTLMQHLHCYCEDCWFHQKGVEE